MGGERETVIPASSTKTDNKTGQIGSVRIHENNGEVHFHDDVIKKLKVAMPVAEWYNAWEKLKSGQVKKFHFIDRVNESILSVKFKLKPDLVHSQMKILCVLVKIEALMIPTEFNSLEKFTTGK